MYCRVSMASSKSSCSCVVDNMSIGSKHKVDKYVLMVDYWVKTLCYRNSHNTLPTRAFPLEVAYVVGKWSLYLLVFVRCRGHVLKQRYSTKYVKWSIIGSLRYQGP